MPEGRPEHEAEAEDEADGDAGLEELAGAALDLDGLKSRGDVAGLLTLAKAYRSGAAPGGRDMSRCLDAYRAAAELGSAEAAYAVALFCMSGGVAPQDLKEGTTHLRAAAEKGSVPAKVYLGNLYDLGVHYKADAEKADVWYRNAARGAGLEADPTSDAYARELAALGCSRYVLALVESGEVDGDEKAHLLRRARAHGYGLRLKDGVEGDRPTFLDALEDAGDGASSAVAQAGQARPDARPADALRAASSEGRTPAPSPKPSGPSRAALGFGAFAYAMLFAAAGLGAAYAATLGARELVSHGTLLPGLGARAHLVFPIVLALVGVLPSLLVYRLGTFIKALVVASAFAGIGWVAWGTGQATLHAMRPVQALAFAIAGFLAGLLALGLLGGTKRQPPRGSRRPSG